MYQVAHVGFDCGCVCCSGFWVAMRLGAGDFLEEHGRRGVGRALNGPLSTSL